VSEPRRLWLRRSQTDEAAEESFGFADEDLAALCDRLDQQGVDVPALLEEIAAIDPDRLMRRYRAMVLRKRTFAEQAARERERLEAWVTAKTQGLDRQIEFLATGLTGAARALAERTNGKVKRLDTPWGYVQLRKQPASLKVEDVDSALTTLDNRGLADEYVRVTRAVNAAALKKDLLAGDVEPVPGVVVEQPDEDKATIYPDVPDLKVAASRGGEERDA